MVPDLPATAPRGRLLAPALVVLLVLLTLGTGAAVVLARRHTDTAAPPTAPALGPSGANGNGPPPGPADPTAPTDTSSTGTEITDPADAENAALSQLQTLRDGDLPTVTLDASWVAQLASKYVGIVDPEQTTARGDHQFAAVDILTEHRALRDGDNLGARVVLLLSTDYGKRQLVDGHPLWVTFAVDDFRSAADVDGWCRRRFPQLAGSQLTNACTTRRLHPPA